MNQIALIILLVVGLPVAVGIWLIVRAIRARDQIEELSRRVDKHNWQLLELKESMLVMHRATEEKNSALKPATLPPQKEEAEKVIAPAASVSKPTPPLISELPKPVAPAFVPPIPLLRPPEPPKPAVPKINWEQFMGVKGFAWLGGLALFLGIAFFVKYSFDNDLIPPQLRVAIGFLAGLGLLVGGVSIPRKNFSVLSQTLCATGVVVLYAVTFACRAHYHFEFFGPMPTFLLMSLITVAAFLLAVRLDALVVAILGMLGGFLTPALLSTGQDNPVGLFSYIAILDFGLVFVALNKRWHFLAALAAFGTVLMQIGWAGKFFETEKYFEGNKIFVALAVLLFFNLLYLSANWLAKFRKQSNWWFAGGNLGFAAIALGFTLYFFSFEPLAQRPVLLFSFLFLIDLTVIALVWLEERVSIAQHVAGLCVFGLLGIWTAQHLTNELLDAALGFYFIFAAVHSALPAWSQKRRGVESAVPAQLNHFFPPLALLLVLAPIFKLQELSFFVWPFVLLVDLLAIVLAVLTATLAPVLIVLLLTLAAITALIFKIPADLTGLPASFCLLGVFAVFFVVASAWLARKFKPDAFKSGLKIVGDIKANATIAALLPASSAVLPFLLLIMATLRLPLDNPSPVFGLALLLVVLLLGLAKIFSFDWMPLAGLFSTFALECAWHFNRFDIANPNLIAPPMLLGWYLIFFAVFLAFPFVFLKNFANKSLPWGTALAGPAQFLLIFRLVNLAWPNSAMGLLPAVFAVPALLSIAVVLKKIPAENKARMTQLALFGGVALFFITLIFPIQFGRQWITIGWAFEGAALLWLFHRVPHPGLRLTGIGLLAASFVRLALNPAVFEYHLRSATPILNWYLYTYSLVTVALLLGAHLLAPPRHLISKFNAQAALGALGAVTSFLLLNIEIADYFSAPGSTLTFQFSGNFARDMTYSIAWGLFALGLLVYGIFRRLTAARYAAMALLSVTLLKLFFHDLAQLGPLYRIGAFIGVAVIAMLASFAYQKFFSAIAKLPEAKDENPK
jgi:uncharacterized membrane protein